MKTTRHSLMAKGIMVLLSLLVLIFAFTYSWFSDPPEIVSASGIQVNTHAGVGFDMAIGFSTAETGYNYTVSEFGKSATLTNLNVVSEDGTEHSYNLLANYSPKDVTGNGRDLYIPDMDDNPATGERTIKSGTTSKTEVTPNREYISFDMIFRCEKECNVYIDNGSYIKAVCETEKVPNTDTFRTLTMNIASDNKSAYGNFSKDAVVGAMRVGFVDYNNLMTIDNIFSDINDDEHLEEDAKFVWLPRPDMYLDAGAVGASTWVLYTAEDESNFFEPDGVGTLNQTSTHRYYFIGDNGSGTTVGEYRTDVKTVVECNMDTIVPVNIPHTYTPEGATESVLDYYYGKCRVNIWVEGCDAEARRAIAGGRFLINFDLRAG